MVLLTPAQAHTVLLTQAAWTVQTTNGRHGFQWFAILLGGAEALFFLDILTAQGANNGKP